MKKKSISDATTLRQKAEEQLKRKSLINGSNLSEVDTMKLIHELQVHQIELEIQNAELQLAKGKEATALKNYAELFDFIPACLYKLSKEGDIIFCNLSGANMLGKTYRSIINCRFGLFISDDTKPIFNLFLSRVFSSKTKQSCEVTLLNEGGVPKTIYIIGLISDNNEQCYINLVDITEHKNTEEKLSKQNGMFSSLLANLHIGVYLMEVPSGKPLLANEASFNLLGRGILPEANASTITQVYDLYKTGTNIPYPNEELPLVMAMSGVSKHVDDMDVVKPDGTRTSLEVFGSPIQDENGSIWASLVSFQDITHRKKADLALLESEVKFKNMVKDMQVGVLLQDSKTEILLSNPKALELLGLTEDQLLGKTSFDPDWNVIHEDGSPFLGQSHPVPQAIATHHSIHDVVMGVYRPSKNDRVWLKVDAELQVYNDDTIKQVVCSFIDITELKKAEQELKNSEQKLLKLNLDKNRFISIIGHDLRNSFSNLLGLSEALIEDICIKNYDETGDIANLIIETTQNASKLLDEILLWARTQQGKIPFKPQKLNFTNVCNNVLEVLRPIAFTKNITIHYSATNQLYVFADLDMLKTVLRNLISNAIKFTNKEGVITISALESPEFVTITISDNGIGISSDVVGKLFDISEVIASKGTAGESGTGLGLLLCKDFIEKHAGNIWVESKIGKGSDFKFTLPVPLEDANDIYN